MPRQSSMEMEACLLRFLEDHIDVRIGMCVVCISTLCAGCRCGVGLAHELGTDQVYPSGSR